MVPGLLWSASVDDAFSDSGDALGGEPAGNRVTSDGENVLIAEVSRRRGQNVEAGVLHELLAGFNKPKRLALACGVGYRVGEDPAWAQHAEQLGDVHVHSLAVGTQRSTEERVLLVEVAVPAGQGPRRRESYAVGLNAEAHADLQLSGTWPAEG
jgi:hypothetical protein